MTKKCHDIGAWKGVHSAHWTRIVSYFAVWTHYSS